MFIIYDFIFIIFALLYLPFLFIKGKWHEGFYFRFGKIPKEAVTRFKKSQNIWIHAVSVGEVMAISTFVNRIKNKYPHYNLICSTVTKTGFQTAKMILKDKADVIFAPLDFSWVVKKFVNIIQPHVYISAETEIWPNLYSCLDKEKVPIVQINGRISKNAFKGYKRARFIFSGILSKVALFCMQTDDDANRVRSLGATSERIKITGNLKFDLNIEEQGFDKEKLGFNVQDQIMIAGSTHPGEEKILIDTYLRLIDQHEKLRLIIVPRHIERTQEILNLVKENHLKPILFSQRGDVQFDPHKILIVDTIGQLRQLYKIANIVFIGKTLSSRGGQNILEPAYFGKPIVIGPYYDNFIDIISLFQREEAVIIVKDQEELLIKCRELIDQPKSMKMIGLRAKEIVERNKGATQKTLDLIKQYIN